MTDGPLKADAILDAVTMILEQAAPQLKKGEGLHIDSLLQELDVVAGTDRSDYLAAIFALAKEGYIQLAPSYEAGDQEPGWDVRLASAGDELRRDVESSMSEDDEDEAEVPTLKTLAKAMKKLSKRLKRLEANTAARSYITGVISDQGVVEQVDGSTTLGDGGPTVDRGIREGIFG